jgi:glycosyltransferase involved in cell wall biosynthesis
MERRLIVEQFDPRRPSAGGVDTCIRGLIAFCPPEVEIAIVGVDAVGDAPLRRWMTVDVAGRPLRFMPVARLYAGDQARRIPHSVKLAAGLRRVRRSLDADVVQTHRLELGAAVQRLMGGTPHVQLLHIDGHDSFRTGSDSIWRHANGMYARLERRVLPRAADVVVFSSAGAERLAGMGAHVRFSPTWFDPALFHPPAAPREPRGGQRVLWVGRIEPPKDPLLAAEVLAALPPASTLTVVGDGTLRERFEHRLADLRISGRADLAGAIAKAGVAEAMRAHDVLLMTSHYEGFPRAVVEALACGLPVVTTPEGEPNGLIVDGRTGLRAGPGRDAGELAALLRRAATLDREACVHSVAHLSAATVVPDVLTIPGGRHGGRPGSRDMVAADAAG